ncbi:MAG: autotransporter assembly complex family protein, partial [Pseudomonadota bacterium]
LISDLATGERAMPTKAALRRAARRDVEAINAALTAAGYYGGKTKFLIDPTSDDDKPLVVFTIVPGPAFKVNAYRIVYSDPAPSAEPASPRPMTLAALNVKGDGSAAGADLQRVQQSFLTALWNAGYPAARSVARRADADLASGTATAVFSFESGPRAVFGDIRFTGAERTSEAYLQDLSNWDAGAPFDRSKLVGYRDSLAQTGLFSTIDVAPGAPADDGAAPVLVTLEERKRRTVGAGVSFSTAEGPGGRLFLEYRNLFGAGELARVDLEGTAIEQSIGFDFTKPLPAFPGSIFAQLDFRNETTEAFEAQTVDIGVGLAKRWFDERFETRGGLAFETSSIDDGVNEERTFFFSAPLAAIWDTEDDPLTLSRGVRAALTLTPFTGSDTFTRAELTARSRVNAGAEDRFTLAGRVRLGATVGASFDSLPLNQRFFAGGGSSVRGFGFQEAGPLDADGDPTGGRSVVEAAVEARARVWGDLQLAAFADAGNISENAVPDIGGDYFIGVGGGARYFTPIGPIRVDVAIPLERRETDRAFQLFISLGQPF